MESLAETNLIDSETFILFFFRQKSSLFVCYEKVLFHKRNSFRSHLSLLAFSIEQIKEAISILYTSNDEIIRNNAQEFLIQWKNDPSSFEISLALLQDPTINAQIAFIAGMVIEDFFLFNKNELSLDKMNAAAEVILHFVINNEDETDQPSTSKLLLILSEMILINFDFFSVISHLSPHLVMRIFCYLYEIANNDEQYLSTRQFSSRLLLSNWNVLSLAQKNLTEQIPIALQLLLESDIDYYWYELYYQLFRFYNDFPAYYPLIEKVRQSTFELVCPNQILKFFDLIFQSDMSSADFNDQQYFKNLIDIFVSTINSIVSNQIENVSLENENIFHFVIYGWDSIFNINDFFDAHGYFNELCELLQHYFASLPLLIRETTTFTDSLKNCTEFLIAQASSELPEISQFVFAFLEFLCELINSGVKYFKDDALIYCFRSLQVQLENLVCEYIKQKIQSSSVTESLFFLLASTEYGFFSQFIDFFSNALVEVKSACSPVTSLFFIRKVGIHCQNEEVLMHLLEITFNLFQYEAEEATLVIKEFSGHKPHLLIALTPQIIDLVNYSLKINIEYSCGLIITLYKISYLLGNNENYNSLFKFIVMFIEQYTTKVISMDTNDIIINSLLDYLSFIQNLLENSPSAVSGTFKSFLFTFFSSSFMPILLLPNPDVQKSFAIIYKLFFKFDFIETVENESIIAKWLNEIIPISPVVSHFPLLKLLIKKMPIGGFPFENILKFSIEFNYEDNSTNEIGRYIIRYFIHPLFLKRKDIFWPNFHPDFILSLLRINFDIESVNNSLKLFQDMFLKPTTEFGPEFAVLVLNTLFQSMIKFYCKLQIIQSLKIVHLIISNKFLQKDAIIQIFLSYFDPDLDGVSALLAIFSNENIDVDLTHEYETIGPIIQLVSGRKSLGG